MTIRSAICFVSVAVLAGFSSAQDRAFKEGLSDAQAGAIDLRGYIKWTDVVTIGEAQRIVDLLKQHKYSNAETLARREVEKGPDNLPTLDLLLQSVLGQRDPEKLSRLGDYFKSLIQKHPGASHLKLALAKCLLLSYSRDLDPPIAQFRELEKQMASLKEKLSSRDVAARIMLADLARSDAVDDILGARKIMEACVVQNPKSVPGRYFLMLCYHEGILASSTRMDAKQRPQPGLVAKQAAILIDLDPKFRPAYYFGGMARLDIGDKPGAKAWLERYLSLHPTRQGPICDRVRKILASLDA